MRTWLIAYIMPSAGILGPGPFFYQMSAETMDEAIQKFEREEYSEEVTHFTIGYIDQYGVKEWSSYKFTSSVRKYTKLN